MATDNGEMPSVRTDDAGWPLGGPAMEKRDRERVGRRSKVLGEGNGVQQSEVDAHHCGGIQIV